MPSDAARAKFAHLLHKALAGLYDPVVLSGSPLAQLFGLAGRSDTASAVRRILTDGIESLQPRLPTPVGSRTWRVYQVLRRRYTEQLTQHDVASTLGFSIRQLQREEKAAREVLADYLWTAHGMDAKLSILAAVAASVAGTDDPEDTAMPDLDADAAIEAPSTAQELARLSDSTPAQLVSLHAVLQDVLSTIRPLVQRSGIDVAVQADPAAPLVLAQVPMLRQALLNVVNHAMAVSSGGRIRARVEAAQTQVRVSIQAYGVIGKQPGVRDDVDDDVDDDVGDDVDDDVEMARHLLQYCQGTLNLIPVSGPDAPTGANPLVFGAVIDLPAAEQATVLVIDDNADTRQLIHRYLAGTRFHFVGAEDAEQALALAQDTDPKVIVLDVMMPKQDGWTLLGQLREHPRLRGVPIIVSTILSQAELAMALGAAEFIRKPVKRPELLAAIDRQLARSTPVRSSQPPAPPKPMPKVSG